MFFYVLEYKSEWAGKHFVKVERFMATSQLCSNCHQKKPMPLSLRTFECGECGMVVDRDLNASQNIKTAGLAALGFGPNACGGA
jgi:putative transposase